MTTANYTMITVAACDASFTQQALTHVGGFVDELKSRAGCVSARYGVVATGIYAGSLILAQSYAGLDGVEKAISTVYAESPDYQSVINSGKVSVTLRNIVKLEQVGSDIHSTDVPAYGVLTLLTGDLMLDKVAQLAPVFQDNGAMIFRYGTLITGSNTGKRLLGVTYPSMDAIEKTYTALRANDVYTQVLTEVDVNMRDIFRVAG